MSSNTRPAIPESIKREVRQRCGFGCVLCGLPLYEYEHMLEWSRTKRHKASEITLLCRFHHGQKTNGLIPKEIIEKANKEPFNLQTGVSEKLKLHYSGNSNITLGIGGSVVKFATFPKNFIIYPIMIDNQALLAFKITNGNLFINYIVFNDFNEPVLIIKENEITYSASLWDIEFVGTTLTVREAAGQVLLKISFNPPTSINIVSARLLYNGVEVHFRENYIFNVNNNIFFGKINFNGYMNFSTIFAFGAIPKNINGAIAIHIARIKRYNINRKESMAFLRKSIKNTKEKN